MEVRDIYAETDKLELHQLHARKVEILETVGGNHRDLSDDLLAELVAITRALRKKAATPGRSGTPRKPKTPKQPASLEDLA